MLKLGAPSFSDDKKPASKSSSKQDLNLLAVIKQKEFTHRGRTSSNREAAQRSSQESFEPVKPSPILLHVQAALSIDRGT